MSHDDIASEFMRSYLSKTSRRLIVCDVFFLFYALNSILLVAYCELLGGYFPFNAYIAALLANVGMLVLTASLRMHAAPDNAALFREGGLPRTPVGRERVFFDFCMCAVVLLFVSVHYMG